MKKLWLMMQGFFKDTDMYKGIFTEIAFVVGLSLLGFAICFVLQR